MKLLLDTHTFIWWDSNPNKLSQSLLEFLQNEANSVFLSVVSLWEIQIKHQAGKLDLAIPLQEIVQRQLANQIQLLPVIPEHVFALNKLPNHHNDPFDRMLVAQSIVEDATVISKDSAIKRYPTKVLW